MIRSASRHLALLTLLGLATRLSPAQEKDPAPLDLELREKASVRLVQLDVTVRGPSSAIRGLARRNFEVVIGQRPIQNFAVDELCGTSGAEPLAESGGERPAASRAPDAKRGAFVLYFDQVHLTPEGRGRSLGLARDLLPTLLRGGGRAMIVSNARALKEYSDLTSDLPTLLGALDSLEKDPAQVEVAPAQEAGWLDALERMVDDTKERYERGYKPPRGEITRDLPVIKRDLALEIALQRITDETEQYVSEERRRVEKSLDRLADFLGKLLDLDPPKSLLYFADTIRSNAGAHYRNEVRALPSAKYLLDHVPEGPARIYTTWADPSATPEAGAYMDRAINAADASGIRLYTVQAEGFVHSSRAVRDAQDTLSGLALETGGKAFLNGATADRIAQRIREDLACLYLISFDPAGLRVDRPLAVLVTVDRPEVTVQVRGRLVIRSESERLVSKLLAASLSSAKETGDLPIRVAAIPAGMDGGRYLGLVQVAVLAGGRGSGRWELGASLTSGGSVRESSAGVIQASAAGVPVIFEEMLKIPPGAHEILALVHEVESGKIGTKRLQGEWADPDRASASIVPVVLLQPREGAFSRDKQTRTSGLLALAPEDPVDPSRPVVLVTLVCRGKREKEPLQVERKLTGETSVDFPALRVEFGNDRCAQVRDVVPENTLGGGGFRYVVRALAADKELTASERPFWVADRGSAPGP